MPTQSRKAKRKTIEPFDYTTAAHAPALKGMTSFLDLSPEVLQETALLSRKQPGVLVIPSVMKVEEHGEEKELPDNTIRPEVDETTSAGKETAGDIKPPGVDITPEGNCTLGAYDSKDKQLEVMQIASVPESAELQDKGYLPKVSAPAFVEGENRTQTASAHNDQSTENVVPLGGYSIPGVYLSPGGNVAPGVLRGGGVGKSKIRRCVLAQDGHSLGEEAIYQVLWRFGKPEDRNPNGARQISIGAAEIGMRANMAKKNVRQNLSRLYEKLAIEVLEDFVTVNSKPRTYRVYSYKQILERRRSAGLEYVLRNKGVVFCTQEGVEIDLARQDQLSPGDKTSPRPAVSKRQRIVERRLAMQVQASTVHTSEALAKEHAILAQALNAHWSVDDKAAEQLLRNCRQIRADARIEEILFFIKEKIELIRTNPRVTNPTGLLLATVPNSFAGKSFEIFRERFEQQQRLAREEEQRKEAEKAAMQLWLDEQIAVCESQVNDPSLSQHERDLAEVRLRGYTSWNR